MRAVLLNGRLETVTDRPVPVPAPGEALVRVLLAGICNTDLELLKGYKDFSGVPGHEFVGVVEEVAADDQTLVGRRVVGEINIGCGSCPLCGRGLARHCRARQVLGLAGRDGAFADFLTLPLGNLHPVPSAITDEEAVFVEPLAAALAVADRVHIRPADRVLVLGDGKLGLLLGQVLQSLGVDLLLAGRHREKLELARRQGIETVPAEALAGEGTFDVVVEATGTASGLNEALSVVRPCGTVVLKSTVARGAELNLTPAVVNEIRIIGSRCGPFGPALRLLAAGRLAVSPMITAIHAAGEAEAAFREAGASHSIKVLLDFREGSDERV